MKIDREIQTLDAFDRPGVWAILADRLDGVTASIKAARVPGRLAQLEAEYQEHKGAHGEKSYEIDDKGRAWIAMAGPLFCDGPGMEAIAWWCGGLTYGQIICAVETAALDPLVREVWLAIDSPGGMVTGVAEAALALRQAGAVKPLYAQAVGDMASAAYWTGCQAARIYASPTAQLGSIGVVVTVYDDSKLLEDWGIKRYVVTDDGAPRKRPDYSAADGLDDLKRNANVVAALFRAEVAAARGVDEAWVLEQMGRGSVLAGPDALAAKLCDAIALDLDATLAAEAARPEPEEDDSEDAPADPAPAEDAAVLPSPGMVRAAISQENPMDIKAAVAAATLDLQRKLDAVTGERDAAVAERDTLRQAVDAYKEREAAAEAEAAKLQAAALDAQIEAMLQRHVLRGVSLSEAQRTLHAENAKKFGVEAVDALLASVPPSIPTQLIGGSSGTGAASNATLHQQIQARATKDGVSYDVAYDRLAAEQPEAFRAAAAASQPKKEPRR